MKYFFVTLYLFLYVVPKFIFADNIYDYSNLNLGKKIPREYMYFLENVGYDANYDDLKRNKWTENLQDNDSFYNGFWIKVSVLNISSEDKLAFDHNSNYQKKIIVNNSKGIKQYDYLNITDSSYSYFDENRIYFDYKIYMPKGEITEVYNYFRSKPLHKSQARVGGMDSIRINTWDNIFYESLVRLLRYIAFLTLCFYLVFNNIATYFVSKDKNYIWFTILILSAIFASIYLLQSPLIGSIRNTFHAQMINSFVLIALITFFRNFIELKSMSEKIHVISTIVLISHIFFIIYYFYLSFDFPHGEQFTNINKYPSKPFGVGITLVIFQYAPTSLLLISYLFITYLKWNKGDRSSGYILISLSIPLLAIPVSFVVWILFKLGVSQDTLWSIIPIATTFFLLIPVFINLALAEKVNQFKKDAFDLLEEKVERRTLELNEANQLITQSINTASIIQNAILPEIDCNKYGFREFEYLWEPRDIVGGDFYWLDKNDHWTSFVVADCTGHGIPGAFMTLISSTLLDRVRSLDDLSRPDVILNQLDELLESKLKLKENKTMEFGMDIGICSFSQKDKLLRFSGAKMNLYKIFGETVNEFKGDKISIGYSEKTHPIEFKNHEIDLSENPQFYIFSDGVTDQVGGSKNLMYGKKRLLKHISQSTDIKTVIQSITDDFNDYQKDNNRRDDLSLFGFSIS